MKLFRNLTVAALTAIATITPAMARVEEGTADLLNTLANNGIHITYNQNCDGNFHGQYRFVGMKREMRLCPGETVDAIDHETVRHEAIHAIQHCVNVARGTNQFTPVMKMETLVDLVNEHLSSDTVDFIKTHYEPDHWAVELEANLMAEVATATEIIELFNEACVGG